MTSKVTPVTEMTDSDVTDGNSDGHEYRCPHCETTYSDERLTRVHITRADDTTHRHRHGFMPEEEIEVIGADGEMIDTQSRRPEEVDLSDISIDVFPEGLSDKRAHTLVVATQHPETDNRRKLTEMVREQIENSDYDVSPPSHQTVRRAIDDFYYPHDSDNESSEVENETLADLTPIQQAIVVAKLVLPDESNTDIADRIGCARSYPGQIQDRKGHVLKRLQAQVNQEDGLTVVLADEFTADALVTLLDEGFLSEIPLDLESLVTEMDVDETSTAGLLATVGGKGSETSNDPQWGSPLDHTTGMCAVPDAPFGSANSGDRSESDGSNHQLSDTTPVTADGGSQDTPLGSDTDVTVDDDDHAGMASSNSPDEDSSRSEDGDAPPDAVIAEIATLRQKVAFFRQTLGPVSQTDQQMALLESFAGQVEQSCKAVLETADHS